jgi:HD-GYP domain-containing protein (c-di-GMP phosphodiesterase class II)
VGISDKVLQKNGPLTEGERDEVRQHPMMGYRIARASPELSHIADLILHHHERWDGAGYPMGLAGEDIPMGCRIIAVVDAFDAMVSERSYRGRLLTEQAVQELLGNAGRQFDPALVEKFVELLNSGELSEVAEEAACVDAAPPEAEAATRPASVAGTPSGSNGGARND